MKDKIRIQNTKIIGNEKVADRYFKITVEASRIAKSAKPGQFVMIKVSDGCEPLLRRPLGIHNTGYRDSGLGSGEHRTPSTKHLTANTIEILYEIKGRGTEILSQKKPGEFLDIIGPLGNGFWGLGPRDSGLGIRVPVLVAGGMGVAPLLFLAERLVHRPLSIVHRKIIILIGAKTKSHIVCADEFKKLGCEVKIATDDGSRGFKGRVTDLLKDILLRSSGANELRSSIYGCGPKPMLRELAQISRRYNIPAQISLEAHMVCGIGACLGCVVNTKTGYKRVCKEGPVFDTGEIIW